MAHISVKVSCQTNLAKLPLQLIFSRARRKVATEKDFLDAVNKVIKAYAKFSSTPKYMTYN